MKISEEELLKNRERMKEEKKFRTKLKKRLKIYKRYFKNRGGYLFIHLIFTLILLITGEIDKFFIAYFVSIIAYEGYIYDLRDKLNVNKN